MKNSKAFIVILLSILILGIVTGCNVNDYQKNIYSDNSKIVKEGDSYTFKNRLGSTTKDEINIKFSTFYGMQTIWIIEASKEGVLTINYESQIKNGDFKTVLISPDDVVSHIFEQSENGNTTLNIPKGKSRIKIVGNGANGEVAITIKPDENMQIRISGK